MMSTDLGVVPAPELNGLMAAPKNGLTAPADADAKGDAEREYAPSLLLVRLSEKLLASPVGVWLSLGTCLATPASLLIRLFDPDTTTLGALCTVILGVAFLLLPLPLFSLRRVTRDDGQLKSLGIGSAKISAKAATGLRRWNIGLLVFTVFPMLVGLPLIVNHGILGKCSGSCEEENPGAETRPSISRLDSTMTGLLFVYVIPLAMFAWKLSLKEASAIVREELMQTRKLIDHTSATSENWDALVVPKMLKLVQTTLPVLSQGLADGLLALWAACWGLALAGCTQLLEDRDFLKFIVVFACIPLGLSADVAGASSNCDTIGTALNDNRKPLDVATDAKLHILEHAIEKENKGAGIGFVVGGGKVLDRATLRSTGFLSTGFLSTRFLSTAVPLILALQPQAVVVGGTACALPADYAAIVRSFSLNSSCSYNMSIDRLRTLKSDDTDAADAASGEEAANANATRPCSALPELLVVCAAPVEDPTSWEVPGCHPNRTAWATCAPAAHAPNCSGTRELRRLRPCRWSNGTSLSSALAYSVCFGAFGADRFYLGYPAAGLAKLCTGGGLIVGWLVDVISIASQTLKPADGSDYVLAPRLRFSRAALEQVGPQPTTTTTIDAGAAVSFAPPASEKGDL